MRIIHFFSSIIVLLLFAAILSACGGADVGGDDGDTGAAPEPTDVPEPWTFDLEWPATMPLDESDTIRLILIPAKNSAVIVAEFANHETVQEDVEIRRPDDYIVNAVARIDAAGFIISPEGEQSRELEAGQRITWHWTVTPEHTGRQSISVSVLLRWRFTGEGERDIREFSIFSRGIQVQVSSILGLNRTQAVQAGLLLAVLAGAIMTYGVVTIIQKSSNRYPSANELIPVELEPIPQINLSHEEQVVLKALFKSYQRVVIDKEFFSGYSGARTMMALPVKADGRRDAYTIVKLSERASIIREYQNFETYVKDSLPPVTGRIQQPPVIFRDNSIAGLQYTFIGEAEASPKSLRQALLDNPDPELLDKFFSTIGPHWWRQHRPNTFRIAGEYDRKLPAHYMLEPAEGRGKVLDGKLPPSEVNFEIGEVVRIRNFPRANQRVGIDHYSLSGTKSAGQPAVRINWMGTTRVGHAVGESAGTRASFLREAAGEFDLLGLPDPLDNMDAIMNETVNGSQSIIHGDLNLENILLGPGNLLWLIDFAETREGHTLYDFAHLATEIIGHILSVQFSSAEEYLSQLGDEGFPLLNKVEAEAGRYLSDSAQDREFRLAFYVSCMGAQKYKNLEKYAKHLLYLTAAYLCQDL